MKTFSKEKIYKYIIILLIILIIICSSIIIWKNNNKSKNKSNIDYITNEKTKMHLDKNDEIALIENYKYIIKNNDDLFKLLNEVKDIYGIKNPSKEFKLINNEEVNGVNYYKVQQLYNDIPVYGKQLIVSTKDDGIINITGHYKKNINVRTYSSMTDEEIYNILNKEFGKDLKVSSKERKIYILNNNTYYVYQIEAFIKNKNISVFIDINNKKIIDKIVNSYSADGKYTYKTKNTLGKDITIDLLCKTKNDILVGDYELYYFEHPEYHYRVIDGRSITRNNDGIINIIQKGIGIIKISTDNESVAATMSNNELLYYGTTAQQFKQADAKFLLDAISTMYNLQQTFDFYKKIGRNSVDNKGKNIRVYLNVVNEKNYFSPSTEYQNANYITKNSSEDYSDIMMIGKYNNVSFGNALDVIGHEFTHGVVSYTAKLKYQGESGALNESYADIMGSLIEDRNFILGEDVEEIRSMVDPSKHEQPSEYKGKYYFPDDKEKYTEEWKNKQEDWQQYDNGGVHNNSSVPNHAAYLAYFKGAFQTKEEMAKVYYNSLFLLNSESSFEDSAYAVIKSAEYLDLSEESIKKIKEAYIETKILSNNNIKVEGVVTDENGKPLKDVEVKAEYESIKGAYLITYTDENGKYVFEELPNKKFTFTFDKGKYEIKTIQVEANNNKKIDNVELKKIDVSKGKSEVVFVMDISYSMFENDPKDLRKQMMGNVISSLSSDTKIALVTFAKNPRINIDGINKKIDNKNIITDVFNITNDDGKTDNSGTNGASGLTKALELLSNKNNRKYIVFFTDGMDNQKNNDYYTYDQIIDIIKDKNIRIITIGLGLEVDNGNLIKLANSTNGKYFNAISYSKLEQYTKKLYEEIK